MVISIVLLVSIVVRLLVGQWGHSGEGKPPMFGDFEAQRHWMEVTLNLNIGDWYRQTKENDLLYWGLDYPPLTAYVSYAFGLIAHFIQPALVELYASRGHESIMGKLFMRLSVIICDIIVFIPAMVQSFPIAGHRNLLLMTSYQILTLLLLINAPSLLLIDHGHFQYNGVCLGFALMGSFFVALDYDILGSVFYCLSLNFKQMSLYYAPVFFLTLLRKCWKQGSIIGSLSKLISLGITVLVTFGVLWAPFCIYHSPKETCASSLLHVLGRQFPFSRGIFEDKVSNIWFSLSVIIDFRQLFSSEQLIRMSLGLTLLLLSPVMLYLLTRPVDFQTISKALILSALSFFLGSFQVHEKSILLAAIPSLLLLETDGLFFIWFQLASCFSMFPLLVRDGLRIPYWCCICIFTLLLSIHKFIFNVVREDNGENDSSSSSWISLSSFLKFLVIVSTIGMITLHSLEVWVVPPARYPDFYSVVYALFSTCMFCGAYIYMTISLWSSTTTYIQLQQLQQTQKVDSSVNRVRKRKSD